jgi:hypothetical protein
MNESNKWDPLVSVGFGFLLSFIVLGLSIMQSGSVLNLTNSATLARFMIQLLGPPVFMLVITFIRNR